MASTADEGRLFSLDLSAHGGRQGGSQAAAKIESGGAAAAREAWSAGISTRKLANYIAPATMFEHKLLEAVRQVKPACATAAGISHELLAARLAALGFDATVRAPALPSERSRVRCLEVLAHTYLVCKPPAPGAEELVIEPRLREQFEVAHPTRAYARLLAAVPPEFVGGRAKLRIIVEALSTALAEAFKAQELSLPPWRRTAAALSKWDLDPASAGRSPSRSPEAPRLLLTSRGQQPPAGKARGFPENAAPTGKAADPFWKLPTGEAAAAAKGGAARKPRVSLLARDLASMAALQPAKRPLEGGVSALNIKRAPSWDFSNLPPITTVKCAGRAG